MNSFGRLFRMHIFGESHGDVVGLILDGVPAGLSLDATDFLTDIERRKGGQTGGTPRKESDLPIFQSGIFKGKTTGAPLCIVFKNENIRSSDYDKVRDFPRPSHADFVANHKFNGFEDYRGGGHFSGRLTLPLVAAGVVAKKLLPDVHIQAKLDSVGGNHDLEAGLKRAIASKDTIGGIVSCSVNGLKIGLGEPFFDSLESLLAHAIFAIPAVRGIEFGTGFAAANMLGLEHNDPIINASGKTLTNHAGGIVGGLSNGNTLYFRVAIKPAASTPQKQTSWNWTNEQLEEFSIKGRHDLCIAFRVPVVIESMTAIVLYDLLLQAHTSPPPTTPPADDQRS